MRATVLKNFPYAHDGINHRELAAGDEHEFHDAHVEGLTEAGLIDPKRGLSAANKDAGGAADRAQRDFDNAQKAAEKAQEEADEATEQSAARKREIAAAARETADRAKRRLDDAKRHAGRLASRTNAAKEAAAIGAHIPGEPTPVRREEAPARKAEAKK